MIHLNITVIMIHTVMMNLFNATFRFNLKLYVLYLKTMTQLPADCLNEIFEYLEDDKLVLYSCIS
jgi:hypothetical protein